MWRRWRSTVGSLRAAFAARGGVEVDTQGDAFLFAFSDPADALAAAAQGQQALERRAGQGADGPAHGRAAPDRRGLRGARAPSGCAHRRLRARRPGRRLGGDATRSSTATAATWASTA